MGDPDDPIALHRNIKGLILDFKTTIKQKDPWDRTVTLQRDELRNRITSLIHTHPYSTHSQALESPLWLELSHALINVYRQKLAALDKSSATTPRPVVQMRKLQTKFRSFLASEESWWAGFALRLVREYGLHEAKPALLALNITSPDPSNPAADVSRLAISSPADILTQESMPAGQREKKLLLLHKVLICLGDLARYKEQYNENGNRPKAGQNGHTDDWKPRRGRGGKKNTNDSREPKPRDYTRAVECYQQARLLIPDNGNPANQLAVMSVWNEDAFGSVYYCFRALCVRQPFPTAGDNLDKTLRKVLESTKTTTESPPSAVDAFKKAVVVLHAIWHLKSGSSAVRKQSPKVLSSLNSMVQSRTLPSDLILKTFVMSIGSLYHIRAFTQPLPDTHQTQTQSSSSPTRVVSSKHAQPMVLLHILGMYQLLLEIGVTEMEEEQEELAQRITAVFRRTLTTLRIASKWLKFNIDYVIRAESDSPTDEEFVKFWSTYASFASKLGRVFPPDRLPSLRMALEEDIDMRGYKPLGRTLFEDKPVQGRNGIGAQDPDPAEGVHPNEEQLMRISDLYADALFFTQYEASPLQYDNGVFFTGSDADRLLATPGPRASATALVIEDDDEMDVGSDVDSHRPAAGDDDREMSGADARSRHDPSFDDDDATASTKTDDDPVNLAMRATLGSDAADEEEDDDDEQILYPLQRKFSDLDSRLLPSNASQPVQLNTTSLPVPPSHSTAEADFDSMPNVNAKIVTTANRMSTTAEDLLAQALGGVIPGSPLRVQSPLAVTPTRAASYNSPLEHSPLAAPALPQPLLFGASGSVWNTSNKSPNRRGVNRRSASSIGPGHGYGLSQSQISLTHQTWGRPQDMFGGRSSSSLVVGTQDTITSQQTNQLGSPPLLPAFNAVVRSPTFNPAPGSDPFDYPGSPGGRRRAPAPPAPGYLFTGGYQDPDPQQFIQPRSRQPSATYVGGGSASKDPWG